MSEQKSNFEKLRPGEGYLDWDGSIKDRLEDGTEIIEYCEKCGKAGADIHKMKGIGDNRHPICEDCQTSTLRHTSVSSLSE